MNAEQGDFPLLELGRAIAAARRIRGLSQNQLADLVGRSSRTINRYETDPPAIFVERDLGAVAKALDTTPYELVRKAYEMADLEPPATPPPSGEERLVEMIRELQGGQSDLLGRIGHLEDLLEAEKKSGRLQDSPDPKGSNG